MEIILILWKIFLGSLLLSGIFCTIIGLLTVFYWLKTPPHPNDDTNRINNIKSWWIGLTRPQVLGACYQQFKNDVMENLDSSDI